MLNNFTTIKWFNSVKSIWVTDYIQEQDGNYCIIVVSEKSEKYSFYISKKLVEDIYPLLDGAINSIRNSEGLLPDVRIINLGFSCNNDCVSGRFEIYRKSPKDEAL